MKYLKITFALFIVALIFVAVKSNALSHPLNNIKVPALQGTYIVSSKAKINFDTLQYIKKTSAKDSVTGVARAVDAKVHGQTAGTKDSNWLTTTTSKQSFGSAVKTPGSYVLYLKASTWAVTGVTFNGDWYYD